MARNHQLAPLVALFAEMRGCAIRTAQWHAKKETADWKAFLATQGGAALMTSKPTVEQGTALMHLAAGVQIADLAVFEGMELPEEMEARHAQQWKLCMAAAEQAARTNDAARLVVFTKAANEARAEYEKARRARIQADIEERRLVPAAEFDEFRQEIGHLAELLRAMEMEIAPMANPERPDIAATALRWWKEHRWNPAISNLAA